jgi:hypothetical protein
MEMEQMMTCLLAKMKPEIRINQTKVNANLQEMKEEMVARLKAMVQNNQEEMLAKVEANNEKFEVL